jgi:hypothetical protein
MKCKSRLDREMMRRILRICIPKAVNAVSLSKRSEFIENKKEIYSVKSINTPRKLKGFEKVVLPYAAHHITNLSLCCCYRLDMKTKKCN